MLQIQYHFHIINGHRLTKPCTKTTFHGKTHISNQIQMASLLTPDPNPFFLVPSGREGTPKHVHFKSPSPLCSMARPWLSFISPPLSGTCACLRYISDTWSLGNRCRTCTRSPRHRTGHTRPVSPLHSPGRPPAGFLCTCCIPAEIQR